MLERIVGWITQIAVKNWVAVVLLAMLVSIINYSLDQANWVRKDGVFLTVFSLAIGFGWLLARSRFRGWFVTIYALLLSAAAAVEAAASVLPSPGKVIGTPFFDLVADLNVRAFVFYLRAAGWVETYRAGQNIQDTGLFILLLSFMLALCGIWLMWTMVRTHSVLNGLLPIGVLFAINVHLSRQPLLTYFGFLFFSLLLIAYNSFNRQQKDWQRRRIDFPEQLGLEWGGSALALALVIVLIARAAPFIGTQEGWQAVNDLVNRARNRGSDTAERLFSGVQPPPPPIEAEPVVYINTPNLREIGEPISQGYETVMWVKTSDPPPIPADIGINAPPLTTHIHYWRSGIYGEYSGRGWQPVLLSPEIILQDEELPEAPPGRYLLRQDFEIVAQHSGSLFSVNNPLQSTAEVHLRNTRVGDSTVSEGPVNEYRVISAATRVTANELAAAPLDYPDQIREIYLQLPNSLPPRVNALAERIAGSAADPFQKSIRIQNYLRDNFPYNLYVEPAPEGRDVVDYFLFSEKSGFCSHYSSAMVVMLRSVGVPSRVVTGYAMGDFNQREGAYRVPVSAAHAWVEVYFPGYGWIEFEPTSAREPFIYPAVADQPVASAEVTPIERSKPNPLQPYLGALVIAAAIALLAMPFLLLRMFAASRNAPPVQVDVLYRRMRRALSWAGLAAVPSTTPDEYQALYAGRLENYTQLNKALDHATSLYRETTYSSRPPDQTRVRIASQLWQQSLSEWLTLWLKLRWERMKNR
jgi:hypothetical protein